jgi:hypothetical protein
VCTTGLTVLEIVVSVDVVADGGLVVVAWATTVPLDVFLKVPAIVVVALPVAAGELVTLGLLVLFEGMREGGRGEGREELTVSYFNSVFVFNFTLSAFSISISLGCKCTVAAVLHVPQACLHNISCFIAPIHVEFMLETCILSYLFCSSGVAAKTFAL